MKGEGMSLRSRTRFVRESLDIPFQQAQSAIRALGERTAALSSSTGVPLKYSDLVLVQETELREELRRVIQARPDITAFGLGVFDQDRKRRAQVEEELRSGQEEMLRPKELLNFVLCCEWLDQVERTKRPTRKHHSYGHKHRVERWLGAFKGFGCHISNGMFIAAAIHKGFEIRATRPGSPNCYLNVSTKSVAALDKEIEKVTEIRRLVAAARSGRSMAFTIDGVPVVGPRGPESVESLCGIKPARFKALCSSGAWLAETGFAPVPPRPDVPTSTWYVPIESLEIARRVWSTQQWSSPAA